MNNIRLWTTPKGDITYYLIIFNKTEPLGIESKNMECSRLGTMLYLEIQKGNKHR